MIESIILVSGGDVDVNPMFSPTQQALILLGIVFVLGVLSYIYSIMGYEFAED
ncbi:MAG: hypothetical protein SV377_03600 [Halobacteria archaeon]|nr:hypothetical protein [Halobacteria archaeon]